LKDHMKRRHPQKILDDFKVTRTPPKKKIKVIIKTIKTEPLDSDSPLTPPSFSTHQLRKSLRVRTPSGFTKVERRDFKVLRDEDDFISMDKPREKELKKRLEIKLKRIDAIRKLSK